MADDMSYLTHKIGPLPVWMWGAVGVGVYYFGKRDFGLFGGSATATPATSRTTVIDESGQLDSEPKFGGSGYSSNALWEDAAINYLVGESVPPDAASAAVWNYLHSKVLTSVEQKDVNLAIEGIGPPPSIPPPAKVTKPPKPPIHHKRTRKIPPHKLTPPHVPVGHHKRKHKKHHKRRDIDTATT